MITLTSLLIEMILDKTIQMTMRIPSV